MDGTADVLMANLPDWDSCYRIVRASANSFNDHLDHHSHFLKNNCRSTIFQVSADTWHNSCLSLVQDTCKQIPLSSLKPSSFSHVPQELDLIEPSMLFCEQSLLPMMSHPVNSHLMATTRCTGMKKCSVLDRAERRSLSCFPAEVINKGY